jgi:hypothetical protein
MSPQRARTSGSARRVYGDKAAAVAATDDAGRAGRNHCKSRTSLATAVGREVTNRQRCDDNHNERTIAIKTQDQQRLDALLDTLAREAEISSTTDAASDDTNAAVFDAFKAAYKAMVATMHELCVLDGENVLARIAGFVEGSTSKSFEVKFSMAPPRMQIHLAASFGDRTERMLVAEQVIYAFHSEDGPPSSTPH